MMSAMTNHLHSFTVQRVVWVPHHYEFERVMGIMRPFRGGDGQQWLSLPGGSDTLVPAGYNRQFLP
jgi:hypothetical protein